MDSTFAFEKRRNRPVRYNRDLFARVIGAMRRVQQVRDRREKAFWLKRMEAAIDGRRAQEAQEVISGVDLIRPNIPLLNDKARAELPRIVVDAHKIRQKLQMQQKPTTSSSSSSTAMDVIKIEADN